MTDIDSVTLDELWEGAKPATERFDPEAVADLPEPARRYLRHAIAPGTALANAVRLTMNGEIRIGDDWHRFDAEQVIRWDRGLIWKARTKLGAMPVTGSDRFIDGQGAMRWKILGLVPVMKGEGPDVSRSAAGRLEAETIWLPSVLLGGDAVWSADDADHPRARIRVTGDEREIHYTIDTSGRLRQLVMMRWGDLGGTEFDDHPFGGVMEDEAQWGGYTIPSRVRIGWHFGTPRFESEGEFFRATVTNATFR